MRSTCLALLLAAGVISSLAGAARADDSYVPTPGIQKATRGLRDLFPGRYSGTPTVVYDTTWVGYSGSNHVGPGNWWNVYAGVNRPGTGNPNNAVWDFDSPAYAHGDSLLGWWPTNDRAPVLAAVPSDDHAYPYACLSFGNGTNNVVPGGSGRTWGVVGAWHADPGRGAGIGVTWAPIGGGQSAWCGLREHGDLSVVDATTHNPYNQDCADFIVQNCGRSVKNFPGYVRAWDQMLYRDVAPVEGEPLMVSFLYRTWMSTEYRTGPGRCGWFHGDPLSTMDGNVTSAYAIPVVDSFTVWVGVPVNDDSVTLSSGTVTRVGDPQRRWFSEVLRLWDPGAPHVELAGVAGLHPALPDTTGSVAFSTVLPWAVVSSIVHAPGNRAGTLRLVFRVQTNETGDDLTSSTWGELGGRGAAQVDDVAIQWGGGPVVTLGDFEGAEGDPDNVNNAVGASPLVYWKSTGKGPAQYFHARPLAGLEWYDLCGVVGASGRRCNMQGRVLDAGNDPAETIGDPNFAYGSNGVYGILSPTIDLTTTASPNPMGITAAMVAAPYDLGIGLDVYAGDFNYAATGCFYTYGCASYPNVSPGTKTAEWGDLVAAPAIYYNGQSPQCYPEFLPLRSRNMVVTSAASGVPDSIRIWVGVCNFPLAFGAYGNLNPHDGAYFDNISFAVINRTGGTGSVGTVSSDIWQWFNDTFPVGGPALGSGTSVAALDTCGALVKGAVNIAQPSAIADVGGNRLIELADSIVTMAPDLAVAVGDTSSSHVRVDMIFRILPGPGNYRANRGVDSLPSYPLKPGMHLKRRPNDPGTIVDPTDPSDHSFWAEYMRGPGAFASGPHPVNPATGKAEWSNLTWNSCRMDTLETNLFPANDLTSAFPVHPGYWQSTMHESDPKYVLLGIPRPRCFLVDTTRYDDLTSANQVCGSAPAWLAALPRERTGWDGALTTIEGTKLIPDGLLTPGSHVQYFLRKSQVFGHGGYAMVPDTQTIAPQRGEDSYDGHRWQEFSVLPDRWKDSQFGGYGMACHLFVDYDDRRGDELVWASVMDSVCGTAASKWGAHSGWHASRAVNLDGNTNPSLQAQAFVYKNAQAGTNWDMYAVRASESGGFVGTRLGGRLGLQGADRLVGHDARVAPTPDMLKQYYTAITLLSGDLDTRVLGPYADMPEDDIALITDFLTSSLGLASKPRGFLAAGSGFAESEGGWASDPVHQDFLSRQLGLWFVNGSYAALANSYDACTDLTSTAAISATDIYAVGLSCYTPQDVLSRNAAKAGTVNVSQYRNTGAGPYYAAVYHQRQPLNDPENFVSLVDGFDIATVWSRYCSTGYGRVAYIFNVYTKIMSSMCGGWLTPCPVLDVPQAGDGHAFADLMSVGNTVVRTGNATVRFGVANRGRVRIRLYDTVGRLVRTLADRTCPAGEGYTAVWDGRDDLGRPAARGVYFARITYASGATIGGRVVLLR